MVKELNIEDINADEGMYILREYGLQAFLDLTTGDSLESRDILNDMRKTLEGLERYEDCAYIVDIITLL